MNSFCNTVFVIVMQIKLVVVVVVVVAVVVVGTVDVVRHAKIHNSKISSFCSYNYQLTITIFVASMNYL